MPVWCEMFQWTLDKPARGWFDHMPNGWTDLQERFALRRKCNKDPTEVSNIIRSANETFPDFKERWTEEMGYIQGVPEVPQMVTKMMKIVDDFFQIKRSYKSTELPKGENFEKGQGAPYTGNRPPRTGHESGHPRTDNYSRRDHYQPYVPRAHDRRQAINNRGRGGRLSSLKGFRRSGRRDPETKKEYKMVRFLERET
nr:hypothetical protein [Tanacetum cinerariifolium]